MLLSVATKVPFGGGKKGICCVVVSMAGGFSNGNSVVVVSILVALSSISSSTEYFVFKGGRDSMVFVCVALGVVLDDDPAVPPNGSYSGRGCVEDVTSVAMMLPFSSK